VATAIVSRENAAPTTEEIIAAYRDRDPNVHEPLALMEGELEDAITWSIQPFDFYAAEGPDEPERGNVLYTDLRPSEAAALRELLAAARERARSRALRVIEEEIVDAVVTFGTRHPNATRSA
jgi:hypothetical protein